LNAGEAGRKPAARRAARADHGRGQGPAEHQRGSPVTDITVSAKDVKALRDRTGAGMMDCKKALTETGGDVDAAVTWLREKGIAGAAKLAGREATEGTVQSYIHANGKVGVLVEVDCNTDFVARNDDFTAFAKDVALHVAAARPEFVTVEDVPEERRSEG